MNPAGLPVAIEIFRQWQRARGGRAEPASRPFSRGWEDLLDDARITSATDRDEAERDARALQSDAWLVLQPVRYRPHLIGRVQIPLDAEPRWREAFGFAPPSDAEARQIHEFPWEPELAFLRDARPNLPLDDLRRLNDYIQSHRDTRTIVPIKERSLQIFGDEKRLDALLPSILFQPDRLDLAKHLRCEVVGVPLAWKRGPVEAAARPVIVLENAATWHSYCRWNAERSLFSAVVYGDGNRFLDSVRYLAGLFVELGGPRRVLYFGDLDPAGLLIPQEASRRAQALGLPQIEPDLWSYQRLLAIPAGATPLESKLDHPSETDSLCGWLQHLASSARGILAARRRIPQEHLGWEFLSRTPSPA